MDKNIKIVRHSHGGVNYCATARANGRHPRTVCTRLQKGEPLEEALRPAKKHTGISQRFPNEYSSWHGARQRTSDPENAGIGWNNYGGRGIRMCERWANSFNAFIQDMGRKPTPEHTIDRSNNEGHYSCGKCEECRKQGWQLNCRWVTRSIQNRNRRDNTFVETPWGRATVTEACRKAKIGRGSVIYRMSRYGMTHQEALDNILQSPRK